MTKSRKTICIIIVALIAAMIAACNRGGTSGQKTEAPQTPVAEAKQTVAAPTLAPPPSAEPPAPPAETAVPIPQEAPKGPVTILPSVEAPQVPTPALPAAVPIFQPQPISQMPSLVPGKANPLEINAFQAPATVPGKPAEAPPVAALQPAPPAALPPEAPSAPLAAPPLPARIPIAGAPAAPSVQMQPATPQAPAPAPPPAHAGQEIPRSAPPVIPGLAQPIQEASAVAEAPIQAIAAPEIPEPPPEPETPETKPQEVRYEPKLVKAENDIEIILDASGSMAAPFGTSVTPKLDVMKQAFYDVLLEMSSAQKDFPRNLAVRVFGSKSPASDGNRDDTELLTVMGAPEADAVQGALAKIEARGMSPIARAITNASKDFPPGSVADRLMVIVADGSDNTGEDACATTAKIEEGPDKIQIHVIAFDIKPEDQEKLECIAKNGDGKFYLARNENELRSALDQAVNSAVPYNLKLAVTAGASPLSFELKVLKAGTGEKIKQESGFGAKLLQLNPGSYDLVVVCSQSPESRKPSKVLKGVDILAGTKVEQTINFELGEITLTALGHEGNPAAAKFSLTKPGLAEVVAELETGAESKSVFITPGTYDIAAELLESRTEAFVLSDTGIEIKSGEAAEKIFRFQKGSLSLKGITTQKQLLPFIFQVYKAGRPDTLVASGAFPSDGGAVLLAPGTYDLIVIGMDPEMTASPRTKISDVEVKSAETAEMTATFEMGTIKLSAIDGQGGKLAAGFILRDHENQMEMANVSSANGAPVTVSIPPGSYDIVASSLKSILDPKPSVPLTGIVVTADKPVEQVVKFVLGTLRLRGRGVKEQSMQTQFTIYKSGTDEKVSSAPIAGDWMVFDLAPGTYDALGTNMSSEEKPPPMIWLRDLKVDDGKSTSHEAIFTAGKLKIIGRGPNNKLITCHFKVFQYGSDREFINGETGDDWEIFEIQPGKYYLEAAYHDDEQSVMLKKWINISVGENEVVEEVLRF